MLTRENGNVHITITEGDFLTLLLCLGYAAGAAHKVHDGLFHDFIRLADTINEGNPNYERFATAETPPEPGTPPV